MITLLSDFGLEDASAAIAKGILMQYVSLQPIVDVSHEVLPFNIPHAAYVFSSAHKYFPAGAVHVLLIDVFSEKINRLILSRLQNQYFLSADNGIVPMIIDGMPDDCRLCAEMKPGDSFNDWLHKAGGAISSLQMQNGRPADFQVYDPERKYRSSEIVLADGNIKAEVIHIDRYENVVINFTRQQLKTLGQGKNFRIQFSGNEEISEISANYNDVRDGYKLCRFNSNDHLEICINKGKAASLFGLRPGSRFNDIKIFFE